jgi:NADH-quinone oxidoreductase subunit G
MPRAFVDGQEVEFKDGERLNCIEAAARAGGIDIPRYCWHPGLSVVASCRMCLVQTGKKDPATGEVSVVPKLVPGCQTPVTDNMVIVTNNDAVRKARAMVEEDLLLRHPVDCPICDKAGECNLQDYHFEYGQNERRADIQPFTSRRRELGETITLFVDRCVMCSRCVRFTREISGTSELMVINRGAHEEIDVFPGHPLANKLSGNVADICPVGALGDRDFLYQQRVWFMRSHDNVCANCSTGCSIRVDENQDRIYRLKPRENPHVNQWWMCDEGRYGWKHVHDKTRVTEPRKREAGVYKTVEWSSLLVDLDTKLRKGKRLAAVISPMLTVEEAYLLIKYVQSVDKNALLVLGYVPVVGEDETFKNGFTIHAEKCPNRQGVSKLLSALAGEVVPWSELPTRLAAEKFDALWITGGYGEPWNDDALLGSVSSVPTLIVQDMFASPLWNAATYQLPGASFAEREGSYVNYQGRLQSFKWAVRPPHGVNTEAQVYWKLLKRPGLYNGRAVMDDVSRELVAFSAAMQGVPPHGVDMKVNQLADRTNLAAANA